MAAPFLYAKACPVLMFHDNESSIRIIKSILSARQEVDHYLAFGGHASDVIAALESKSDVCLACSNVEHFRDSLAIANFVKEKIVRNDGLICIASQSLAQWPELLSSAFYVAMKGAVLLLLDQTSLDSFASCLDFVSRERNSAAGMAFIGGKSGLSDLELSLLVYEFFEGGK